MNRASDQRPVFLFVGGSGSHMNPAEGRYRDGSYDFNFGYDLWKAREMREVIGFIPDVQTVTSYADIGCGNGGVFVSLYRELVRNGFPLHRATGYDIASAGGRLPRGVPR